MREAIRETSAGRQRGHGISVVRFALLAVLLAAALSSCIGGVADPDAWYALTPSDGHTVLALADDPFNTSFVYAGTTGGLVYRAYAPNRADGVAGTGIPSDAVVSSLAADTKKPLLIYAGTSSGFYASTDRGNHWTLRGTGLPGNDTVDALAVSTPANVLFAGTTAHGVYASSDAGQTWSLAATGLPANEDINTLYWEPQSQTLYVGVDGVGVFASTDSGATWTSRNQGLSTHPYAFAARQPVAVTTTTGTPTTAPTATPSTATPTAATLYVGTDQGVFSSTDDGNTWSSLNFANSVQSLALDPQHPTWIYAGTDSDVFRSQDDGQTWNSLAPGINHPVSSLLTVVPAGQQTVLYAGAGQLQRFPPYASGSDSNPVLGTIFLVVLFLVILLVFFRNRQRMVEVDRRLPLGMQPDLEKPKKPDGIERYINMTPPPTLRDGQPPSGPSSSRGTGNPPRRADDFTDIEN